MYDKYKYKYKYRITVDFFMNQSIVKKIDKIDYNLFIRYNNIHIIHSIKQMQHTIDTDTDTIYSSDYIQMLRTFLIIWAHKHLCNKLSKNHIEADLDTWKQIFKELHPQMKYYIYVIKKSEAMHMFDKTTPTVIIYERKTFQEYIDKNTTLQRMGPYEYIQFCENMKDKSFVRQVKNDYEKSENIKIIQNDIINGVYGMLDYIQHNYKIEFIDTIPFYEFISKNNIVLDDDAPQYVDFRNNKLISYELYTLWQIKQYIA